MTITQQVLPLPFVIQRFAYLVDGQSDSHGNAGQAWAEDAELLACVWFTPDTSDQRESGSGNRAATDVVAYVRNTDTIHPRDRFVLEGFPPHVTDGPAYLELESVPLDFNHGPAMAPGLLVLQLRRIEDMA